MSVYLAAQLAKEAAVASHGGSWSSLLTRRRRRSDTVNTASLAEEVRPLRQGVSTALTYFVRQYVPDKTGAELHAALRDYLVWQLHQEALLIESAFNGFGPQR